MSMLNFFQSMADKMKQEPTGISDRMNAVDQKYGTDALGFIKSQFQRPEAASMIDSANLMSQTNSAAGIVNPAAMMLESNAQAANMSPALAMADPRSNDRGGILEEPEMSEEERAIRKSYEDAASQQPYLLNKDLQPYGSDQALPVYG